MLPVGALTFFREPAPHSVLANVHLLMSHMTSLNTEFELLHNPVLSPCFRLQERLICFPCCSFASPLPWSADACGAGDADCQSDPDRALPLPAAFRYFDDVTAVNRQAFRDGVSKNISGPLFGGAAPQLHGDDGWLGLLMLGLCSWSKR